MHKRQGRERMAAEGKRRRENRRGRKREREGTNEEKGRLESGKEVRTERVKKEKKSEREMEVRGRKEYTAGKEEGFDRTHNIISFRCCCLVECYSRPNHTTTRISIQTAGLAFGGTGLCSCRARDVVGSCAKHLTVESYMVIYAVNSYTYYY